MSTELVLTYAFLINVISFVLMYVDKQRAIKAKWRISERKLLLLAVLGGSIGIIVGMRLFRHKTKHFLFKVGMPIIFLIQIVLMSYHY